MNETALLVCGIGLFFVLSGLLVGKFPILIGYKTTEQDKEKVNIDGYTRMIKSTFVFGGVFLILVSVVFSLFGLHRYLIYVLLAVCLLLPACVLYRSKKIILPEKRKEE
ncbi:MAG: DUF3784 domain-containing protein [Prevotellaceae bacterium]|jgi:hypothetical protein|nr:DUF3784 domain-containing protein [Prevotellaceae bacterium]